MTNRILLSVAIFGPIYVYLAFSWTQCIDGSCQNHDSAQYMVVAVVAFVLLLLLVGIGSAISGAKTLRQAQGTKTPEKIASGGLDIWLSLKLLVPAAVGVFVLL